MGRKSPAEMKALKKKISDLATIGYTTDMIAEEVNLSASRVTRHLSAFREARAKEMNNNTGVIIGQLIESQKKRERYLFSMVAEGTERQKLRAIHLLQMEDQMRIKRNQLVGNLPQDTPLVAIQNNVTENYMLSDSIRKNFPELIEKFEGNKIKKVEEVKDGEKRQT